jgi:hypothetical protein
MQRYLQHGAAGYGEQHLRSQSRCAEVQRSTVIMMGSSTVISASTIRAHRTRICLGCTLRQRASVVMAAPGHMQTRTERTGSGGKL